MNKFGWSYPPGYDSVPGDEPEPNPELPTVREFCSHIGISPLHSALRAIDKYNGECVSIRIERSDEWITPDNCKARPCHDNDPIEAIRVSGIAWDGTDWEFSETVEWEDGIDMLEAMDIARSNFESALALHIRLE